MNEQSKKDFEDKIWQMEISKKFSDDDERSVSEKASKARFGRREFWKNSWMTMSERSERKGGKRNKKV